MTNQSKSSLSEILEKINAGKAALEQNEIDDLFANLSIEINRTVKENFLNEAEESQNWLNILNGLFESELANSFMKSIDKELFFSFGSYLDFIFRKSKFNYKLYNS